jgi:hypothetical protein
MAVVGFTAAFLSAGLIAPPAARAEELPSCRIRADAPVEDNGIVIGTAHREGCAQNRKTITVRIREDFDFWPDETLAERTWTNVVNDDFTVTWDCPRDWEGNAFTEILTNAGGKSSSTRRELHCFS